MTATLIKGTEIREQILEEITAEVAQIKEKHGVVPGLVTILVGESPASISYVTLKIKTAHRVGFHEVQDNQPDDISEEDLLALIDKYNNDESINGILVQLPLPWHLDEEAILNSIDLEKDVLSMMDFRPEISPELKTMNPEIFKNGSLQLKKYLK